MKSKKHKPKQIIKNIREADAILASGKTIGQATQVLALSEQTFHRWRNQYGSMKAEKARRLKELEDENKRLNKLLAEARLDKEIVKEALEGNYRARRGVASRSSTFSGRRTCQSVGHTICLVSHVVRSDTKRRRNPVRTNSYLHGPTSWCESIPDMDIVS